MTTRYIAADHLGEARRTMTLEQIFDALETPGVPHLEKREPRPWERDTSAVPCGVHGCRRPIQLPGPRAQDLRFLGPLPPGMWCDSCARVDTDDRATDRREVAEHARANP